MKKSNFKMKQYSVIAILVVICIALVGLIFSASQRKVDNQQMIESEREEDTPTVAELDYTEEGKDINDENSDDSLTEVVVEEIAIDIDEESVEESLDITVEPIDLEEDTNKDIVVVEKEEVEVPMAEEPEKPDLTSPEQKPETTDDLTNPDKEPEYEEEETTYVPEPEPEIEQEDEVRGSNLVPDSENPFSQDNIPSNGDGGEQQGSDFYQDGNPAGEGDKF